MIVTLFTACGSATEGKKDTGTTAATTAANAATTAADTVKTPEKVEVLALKVTETGGETYLKLADEFNKSHPDIQVNIDMIPWANYTDKVTTNLAAGMVPDASSFKYTWLPAYIDQKILYPLDDLYSKWQYKDDMQSYLIDLYQNASPDKKLYFMPFSISVMYVYYRKDLFEAAGITKTPETWDDFLVAAQKLTKDTDGDGKVDQYGVTLRPTANGHEAWYSFLFGNMKDPSFYDENGKLSFTSPEVIEGNQFFIDLFKKYKVVPPTAPSDGTNEGIAYLNSGKAAMMVQHLLCSQALLKGAGEDKIGVFKIPLGKNGKRFVNIGEYSHVIYSASKVKESAFKFISWLVEPEQHKQYADVTETVVFLKSLIPTYKDNPYQQMSIDSLSDGKFAPISPYTQQFATKEWPALVAKGMLQDLSSADMMQQVQEKFFPDEK